MKTHCKSGHPLSGDNLYLSKEGYRYCRECHKRWDRNRRAKSRAGRVRHEMSRTHVYMVWQSMIKRCFNKKCKEYKRYGGRGITVCDDWCWFENFYADMGDKPKGRSLDRIDNDGHYEPDNCRWATPKEQSLNQKRTRWFTFNGETLCMNDWDRRLGFVCGTFRERLKRGWSVDRALPTPNRR